MDHVHAGVLFSEKHPSGVRAMKPVEVLLDDKWVGGSQIKTLEDVKAELAKLVKEQGGDSLIGFTYGQKSVGFWKSLLSVDDVIWWGKGIAGKRTK
jgi:hypothetical protein